MNTMFGNSMFMTQRSLDYLWEKQNVTMENIANADTPGYKTKYVTFEESLASSLSLAREKKGLQPIRQGIGAAKIQIHSTKNASARMDENNVQMDVENVELARTTLQYQAQLQSINQDISRLSTVIKA